MRLLVPNRRAQRVSQSPPSNVDLGGCVASTASEKLSPLSPFTAGLNTLAILCCLSLALLPLGCAQSLHDTVSRGDLAQVRAMLAADPSLVHSTNELHKTPLHYAVHYKQLDILPILLEHGADLNAKDITGLTPLHVAAIIGQRESAEWLLSQGAELEPRDNFGDTPVHTAALFHGGLLAVLEKHGASLDATNNAGKTPLDLARENRNAKAAAWLEKRLKSS
jgi:ankyrin repeat protein